MNNKNLVSIIITTYKRDVKTLSKAINSVLNQTYKEIELIIIDDSPNEFSDRENVKKYCKNIKDSRVKYLQHSKNMGACVARNTGISMANGEYICFLDDDDEYFNEKIRKMVEKFNKEIVLVYCDIAMYQNGKYRKKYSEIQKPRVGMIYDEIMKVNFIGPTSIALMKTSLIKEVGGFDPKMEASQDWDLWIRISKKGKIDYINEVLFKYNSDGGTSTDRISNDTNRRIRALQYLNKKNIDYLHSNKATYAARKEYEMRMNISINKIIKAIECYADVIKYRPNTIFKNIILLKAFGRIVFKKKI